jgi:hypothetical protein
LKKVEGVEEEKLSGSHGEMSCNDISEVRNDETTPGKNNEID